MTKADLHRKKLVYGIISEGIQNNNRLGISVFNDAFVGIIKVK
jgi:hypothetical protein